MRAAASILDMGRPDQLDGRAESIMGISLVVQLALGASIAASTISQICHNGAAKRAASIVSIKQPPRYSGLWLGLTVQHHEHHSPQCCIDTPCCENHQHQPP